jgi:hypothetical protein
MDPKANLAEQIATARHINAVMDDCPEDGNPTDEQLDAVYTDACRLAELVLALDEWQRKGGFSPYEVSK